MRAQDEFVKFLTCEIYAVYGILEEKKIFILHAVKKLMSQFYSIQTSVALATNILVVF